MIKKIKLFQFQHKEVNYIFFLIFSIIYLKKKKRKYNILNKTKKINI
jgi:hypothetical protein